MNACSVLPDLAIRHVADVFVGEVITCFEPCSIVLNVGDSCPALKIGLDHCSEVIHSYAVLVLTLLVGMREDSCVFATILADTHNNYPSLSMSLSESNSKGNSRGFTSCGGSLRTLFLFLNLVLSDLMAVRTAA
jgi:hypothetical protein